MSRMTHFLREKISNRTLKLGVLGNLHCLSNTEQRWSTPAFSFLRAVLEFSVSLTLFLLNSVPPASFCSLPCFNFKLFLA